MTDNQQKAINNIKEFGWHVINVPEDEHGAGFSYSIGFTQTYNHPEIIITGLSIELRNHLINDLAKNIKLGETYNKNCRYDDLLENNDVIFLEVLPEFYAEYFGFGRDLIGYNIKALQCFYPNKLGRFPFEEQCHEDFKKIQPSLASSR